MVCFTGLPILYLVSTAFKPLHELLLWPPTFLVRHPTLQNFSDLTMALSSSTVPFVRYIFNSIIIVVPIVILTVIVCSMGAYGLVKHSPPGTKMFFNLVVAALMFSPHVTRIPSFMVINTLHLVNTYWAIILPAIAAAYNFFLMKQFLEQFPNELLEAGRIDGAKEFYIYWRIVMPALTPAWATLVVFSFVNNWNDYISPLIYLYKQNLKPLPLALQNLNSDASSSGAALLSRAGALAMASFLATVPTIIIFTVMQSRVMETMTYSGIKG